MTDLMELASRVEAGEGPDRELDAAIAVACKLVPLGYEPVARKSSSIYAAMIGRFSHPHDIDGRGWVAPAYTASLDAAMSLVPEGWSVGLGHLPGVTEPNGKWRCRAHLRDCRPESLTKGGHSHIYYEGHHTDLAIALTAAALRARAHQGTAHVEQ